MQCTKLILCPWACVVYVPSSCEALTWRTSASPVFSRFTPSKGLWPAHAFCQACSPAPHLPLLSGAWPGCPQDLTGELYVCLLFACSSIPFFPYSSHWGLGSSSFDPWVPPALLVCGGGGGGLVIMLLDYQASMTGMGFAREQTGRWISFQSPVP